MSTTTGEAPAQANTEDEGVIEHKPIKEHARRTFRSRIWGTERSGKQKLIRAGKIVGALAISAVAAKAANNIYQNDQAKLRANERKEAARIQAERIESRSSNPLSIVNGTIEVGEGAVFRENCVIKDDYYVLHRSNVHSKVGKGMKLTLDSPQRVVVDGTLFLSFSLDNDKEIPDTKETVKKPVTATAIAAGTYCIDASSLIEQQGSSSSSPLITRLESDNPNVSGSFEDKIVTGKRLEDGTVITAEGDRAAVGRIDPIGTAEWYQETYDFTAPPKS